MVSTHRSTGGLRLPLLASLFLLFAFGIIGLGVGINALVKFHKEERDLKRAAPPNSSVSINANDVLDSGYNATVMCGVLAVLAVVALVPALAARFLRVIAALIGFFTVWLFAALVAFTTFFANRSAQVQASIAGIVIDNSTIQTIIASLGATTQYKHINYLRLPAIIQWFTFLFGLTSTVLAFLAARRRTTNAYPVSSAGVETRHVDEKKEAAIEQRQV